MVQLKEAADTSKVDDSELDQEKTVNNYDLAVFVASLATTSLAYDIAEQIVNAGVAHGSEPKHTLAAYGVARQLILWMCSCFSPLENVGLVLVTDRLSYRLCLLIVIILGIATGGVILLLAAPPLSKLVLQQLFGIPDDLLEPTKSCLRYMAFYPLLEGLSRIYRGIVLKHGKHTTLVWISSSADISMQALAVVVLSAMPPSHTVVLPVAATVAGLFAHTAVLYTGFCIWVNNELPAAAPEASTGPQRLTAAAALKFSWPLMVVQLSQRSSRPIVNMFVSRSRDSATSLAALSVVYPLAHLGYGWLNMMRPLLPAYVGDIRDLVHLSPLAKKIISFMSRAVLCSFVLQIVLLWTPLKMLILKYVMNVPHDVAHAASVPLFIFAFNSLPVGLRSIAHAWCTASKMTKSMASSAAVRFFVVLAALVTLFRLFPTASGASLGIASLVLGFACEALFVASSALDIKRKMAAQLELKNGQSGQSEAADTPADEKA